MQPAARRLEQRCSRRLGGVIATEPTGVAAPVLVRDGGGAAEGRPLLAAFLR